MSTLSKKEKQALNELFLSLGESNNSFDKFKRFTNELILFIRYKLKSKKAKNPFL